MSLYERITKKFLKTDEEISETEKKELDDIGEEYAEKALNGGFFDHPVDFYNYVEEHFERDRKLSDEEWEYINEEIYPKATGTIIAAVQEIFEDESLDLENIKWDSGIDKMFDYEDEVFYVFFETIINSLGIERKFIPLEEIVIFETLNDIEMYLLYELLIKEELLTIDFNPFKNPQ